MKLLNVFFLAGLVLPAAQAADLGPSDTIVVTATRSEMSINDVIVPVTVISREDIELSSATDLAELLRFEAGIDIGRNGGPGQATSVFLRGTESNHTLVLVDGVRMNPGTIGGAAFQHISPEMIERVEIVKGARSALFGTEAIGGVINIITRRADETRFEAGLGGGSFNTVGGFANGSYKADDFELGITLDWAESDGFSPRVDADIDRGYDNLSVNAHATRSYAGGSVGVRHWQASGNVEYLDFFLSPVDQDFRNSTTALEWQQSVTDNGTSRLLLSAAEDDITQNQVADFVRSERTSLDWQYSHALQDHLLTVGAFYMDESAETLSFGSGFDEGTDVSALFVQDQWTGEEQRAFVALRFTDHETFGNETTWNLEYARDLSKDVTLSAGIARAFRAPDASDRFGFGGNVDLKPEIADEWQLGLRYRPEGRHSVDLELYNKDIDDLIEFEFVNFTLINIDEARIRGAELTYEYTGDNFRVSSTLVNQRADNRTTDARLLRRAEQSLSVRYQQDIGNHRLGLSVIANGDREDFGGVPLAGYVLANLTGQFRLSKTLQLNARIENLLDTNYETASGFRMQEQSAFVELRSYWK